MGRITLKSGREDSVLRRHPWIFAGAIEKIDGSVKSGETVDILAANGTPLGYGAYSPLSQIRTRIWTFDPKEKVTPRFFATRLDRALAVRNLLGLPDRCSGYRLINAESDGLPGIIIDRYDDFLVCQFLSAGAEYWKKAVVRQLRKQMPVRGIYERSDGRGRTSEGLEPCCGVLFGEPPPELVKIREGPLRFLVDIHNGHKTGFYLDQRENRAIVSEYAKGAEVLNCFAYTGGFGLYAYNGGAKHVTNIEMSKPALDILRKNIELNGLEDTRIENTSGDVFELLRKYRDSARQFDVVILDPPKFAQSSRQVKRAARGYKDINLFAIKLIKSGGVLFTFSCSGHVSPALFQKIVSDAALDADRHVQIIQHLGQAPDHPVSLNFPEGHYLKGLLCRVW